MSSTSLTQVFSPDDAVELAQRAAEHEVLPGGWLLEIAADGQRFVATTGDIGGIIVVARKLPNIPWLVIPVMPGAPKTAVRCNTEVDALEWLNYLADLHAAAVSA